MNKKNLESYPYYIGLMSGTSMDGIDAVLCAFPENKIALIATHNIVLSPLLKSRLENLCLAHQNINLLDYGKLDTEMGRAFATCCLELLKKSNTPAERVRAIGSPGQTVLHAPEGPAAFTLQIGDPNIIATMTHITTVADFRRRDLALGGQGAPLTPAFHHYLFHSKKKDRIVLNIGGIANLTVLPADPTQPIIGFDTGPGNTLLDTWCWQHTQQPFDYQGRWAASGIIEKELLESMLQDAYFSRVIPKSTGREYFNPSWLSAHLNRACKPFYKPEDIQATLTALTALTIARGVTLIGQKPCDIFVCGGGIHNIFLLQALQEYLPHHTLQSTDSIGLPPQWVEAAAFAWLAQQTLAGRPGNLPSVTGAQQKSILGAIYNV